MIHWELWRKQPRIAVVKLQEVRLMVAPEAVAAGKVVGREEDYEDEEERLRAKRGDTVIRYIN
jgi:hypothetical protein